MPAHAASVARTYSYFAVGGNTLQELQEELVIRGPQVKSTGQRHPGATIMEFSNRLGYQDGPDGCRVAKATVSVKARIILPRWKKRANAGQDARLIWDTLSSDIKRHEESHVVIARNHARAMEEAVLAIPRQKSCAIAAEKARLAIQRVLASHDSAQNQFDRIEGINFSRRMERLLRYRIEQIEAGRIPG
ncbi:MAG: DUF922 domain-containing protein [Mesorhizobium sp.]|nr:DUF922 domain-containing protein [Mesorhizobium sp.]